MKKIVVSLVSVLLLLTIGSGIAFANGYGSTGDQGGQYAAGFVSNQIPPQLSAPVNEYRSESSYQSESVGAYDPYSDLPWDMNGDSGYISQNNGSAFDPNSGTDMAPFDATQVDPSINTPSVSTPSGSTQSLDWYNVGFDLINKNKSITVYDINSGITWGATYINGKNHADIIPASQADAQKLVNNKITGDYVRRPVVVTIAGQKYAGSMYAVGHGNTSYCNYFSGVMCIHFTGSQTHGSQKVDTDHQNAIGQALQSGY